jgi:hypothetical protein
MTINYPIPNHPWVTVLEAPLYMQAFPPTVKDEELSAMLAEVERITMAMQSPYGWVADISNVISATPKQRSMYAESDKRLKEYDQKYCAGSGIFCTSNVARGVLTAVFWISPPVYPYKVTSTLREAETWARQQLIARGVQIGPLPRLKEP